MNTLYLFEDQENTPLPEFFKSGFCEETSNSFRYSNGNGALRTRAEELLEDPSIQLVIFVDLVPNNIFTASVFTDLCVLARKNLSRVLVIPILGSEYYFIKSLQSKDICKDRHIEEVFCNIEGYTDRLKLFFESLGIKEKRYATFEKLGKRLIEHNYNICISHPNDKYRSYFKHDCRCEYPKPSECKHKNYSTKDKTRDLLMEYSIIPSGSLEDILTTKVNREYTFRYIEEYLSMIREKAEKEFKMPENKIIFFDEAIAEFKEFRSDFEC